MDEEEKQELKDLRSLRYWMHHLLDRYNSFEDEIKIDEQYSDGLAFTDKFKAKKYNEYLKEIDELWFNK